jgi:hypothetical protein
VHVICFDNPDSAYFNQILWNNSHIIVDGKTVFKSYWFSNGIKFVKDIMYDDGRIMSYTDFINKYNLHHVNFMEYFSIVHAIPNHWKCERYTNIHNNVSVNRQET